MRKTVPKLKGESYVHIFMHTCAYTHIYVYITSIHTACGDGKRFLRASWPTAGFRDRLTLLLPM